MEELGVFAEIREDDIMGGCYRVRKWKVCGMSVRTHRRSHDKGGWSIHGGVGKIHVFRVRRRSNIKVGQSTWLKWRL